MSSLIGPTSLKSLTRSHLFVAILLSLYINPFTLLIGTTPETRIFLIFNTLLLIIWLWVGWGRIKSSKHRGRIPEIFIGSTLVIVAFAANLPSLRDSSFGITDMFLVFIGLMFVFYGIKGLKTLNIPTLFFIIMISATQLELAFDAIRNFEYILLGTWGSSLGPLLGIEVDVFADIARVTVGDMAYFAQLDGPLRGIRGIVAYGSLAAVMLVAPKAPRGRKILLAFLVVAGTYLFTIARLGSVLLAILAIGIDGGLAIQDYLGYIVLTGWILLFRFIALPFLKRSPTPVLQNG